MSTFRRAILMGFAGISCSVHSDTASPPVPDVYAQASTCALSLGALLGACKTQHYALLDETNAAEAGGIPVYLERSTLAVAEYFVEVASNDNASWAQSTIKAHYRSFYTKNQQLADSLAANLPCSEASATLQILQSARAVLNATTSVTRPPLPSRSLYNSTVCNGYMCNDEGIPTLGIGFNVWDESDPPFDSGVAEINLNTVGFSAKYLLQNNTWPTPVLNMIRSALDNAVATKKTLHILMGQAMPEWAEEEWPGLNSGNFTSHGVSYDIDNPGASIVLARAITAYLDAFGCHPAFGGWILANEPVFPQSNTPYTMDKYRGWLEARYSGDITALNLAWSRGFVSFSDITEQPAKPSWKLTMVTGGMAAEWWDWNEFNNLRVTQFFERIVQQLNNWSGPTTSRCMATTIKLQNVNEFAAYAGMGINRTALVALQTINGNDMNIRPRTAVSIDGQPYKENVISPTYVIDLYVAEWVTLAASYTLQRSVDFSKPLYNTEWHGASTLAWRDEALTASYIEFAVWVGLYYGEALNVAWYFPRTGFTAAPKNKFAECFAGSFATQPVATDAFLRTFMLAAPHGETVAALARQRPRLWLLRSWSSFALNTNSTMAILSTFEFASFTGLPLGFVFEELRDLVGPNDVVVIPGTTHAHNETVGWLRHLAEGGRVMLTVDPHVPASEVLRYNPSGTIRAAEDRQFVSQLPRIELDSAASALEVLTTLPVVAKMIGTLPARCLDEAASSQAFGVLCKFVVVADRLRGLVINLNAKDTVVILSGLDLDHVTELRSGRVMSSTLHVSPAQVLLLDIGPAPRLQSSRSLNLHISQSESRDLNED